MWWWRRRVEAVRASRPDDDAAAALTTILRYHGRRVTLDEVRQAVHRDRSRGSDAGDIVEAATCFRLRGHGLAVDHPEQLARIATPNIAHMMHERGQFPRSLEGGLEGYFAVVVSISPACVRWLDPYAGQIDDEPTKFLEFASGVFLVFDDAAALPRAKLAPS